MCVCVTSFFDVYSDACYDKKDNTPCKSSLQGNKCIYLKKEEMLNCGCKKNTDCAWKGYSGKTIHSKCDKKMHLCKDFTCKLHSECPDGYFCTVDLKPADKFLKFAFKMGTCLPIP